jgi:hypothetical protein
MRIITAAAGARGANPSANFDTSYSLLSQPYVAARGVDLLSEYLSEGQLQNRVIFPVNPNTGGPVNRFDAAYYLAHNPDVAAAGVDPLLHYDQSGWREGRNPSAAFSTNGYFWRHIPTSRRRESIRCGTFYNRAWRKDATLSRCKSRRLPARLPRRGALMRDARLRRRQRLDLR